MTNIKNLMQQAQQMKHKMQEKMEEMERKLEALEIEGQSGGGMVKATVNGKSCLLRLKVDPGLMTGDDVEMMEDLIVAAVNTARSTAEKISSDEAAKFPGGLGLPTGRPCN